MPKNKRPNRKPGAGKTRKPARAGQAEGAPTEVSGAIPNVKGARSVANTFGRPKSRRSPISPAMHRTAPRNK